jgi:hypothetical protein
MHWDRLDEIEPWITACGSVQEIETSISTFSSRVFLPSID